jgi:hypothetical protein
MKISYFKQEIRTRLRISEPEKAFSVVEALVAAIIIVIILLSTAVGLSSGFRSSATVENSNKAAQLANDVIAISRQSPYRDLWVSPLSPPAAAALIGAGKCSSQNTIPTGTLKVTDGASTIPFKGLTYCEQKQFGDGGVNSSGTKVGIGTTFYVETKIVFLNTLTSSDGISNSSIDASGKYYSKRVFVTVRWQDVSTGPGAWKTYKTSYTKAPTTSDCIPDRVLLMNPSGYPSGSPVTSKTATGCVP